MMSIYKIYRAEPIIFCFVLRKFKLSTVGNLAKYFFFKRCLPLLESILKRLYISGKHFTSNHLIF